MSYHFMTYDKRDGFDYQRRNTLQETRLDTRDGEHIHGIQKNTNLFFLLICFSFFFFLVHIVCSIGLSTLNCFSFTIVLNAKYTALHTKHRPNVSIRLSISTQNHEKHHYFNNSIIIIPSNFFNQCQHSKDVIQRNAIRKVLGINVRCHLSLTLHCETENFWSTIKKFDLYYRSSREIFHRIGKLFPIQTCSISYFIGKQRSLGYSGK